MTPNVVMYITQTTMILIIDFGSQTTHLIARRLRELSVATTIIEPEKLSLQSVEDYSGIILSGGPGSVYEEGPTIDPTLFELGKPILGICYGLQLIAHTQGGTVKPGKKKEYGPVSVTIQHPSPLFASLPQQKPITVWMSHGDEVATTPPTFTTIASTKTIPHTAIADEKCHIYGIQFHPEVVHTQYGLQILEQFAHICGEKPTHQHIDTTYIQEMIDDIRDSLSGHNVIGAFSGGVDSSIASLLMHKALGDDFTPIYIDSGLMRQGETEELERIFHDHYRLNVVVVDVQNEFLQRLQGVTDPEEKRIIIGNTFIHVLQREAEKRGASFLMQGTIYPDVIESKGSKHSHHIKSHHNVGGLPKDMKLTLVEPLRNLYKDQVRAIGTILELPESVVHRHIFPGPGLAIRIMGEVTKDKLTILRKADAILREEINKAGYTKQLWQVHAIFTGIKTTGVRGDQRVYGETIALGAIESKDAMSANFAHLPWDLLNTISVRIVTEVPEVNRVVYDITNKPPGTIEWE